MSMYPCRWLEVFVFAWCVAWAAGQEGLTQASAAITQSDVMKLVSAELHPNAAGNLETRCLVLTTQDVPGQPQTTSKPEQPAAAALSVPEPTPPGKCPPSKTATQVYDSESFLEALTGTASEVSSIREEAKKYFVAYNRERSFSKAQILEMILVAMMAEHEGIADGINTLKSQIRSGGFEQDSPQVVAVCLPDDFKVERILNDCVESDKGAAGPKTTYAQVGVTPPSSPFGKEDPRQDEKPEVKTVVDLLKGSAPTSPTNEVTQLPSRQPLSSFSTFATSSERLFPRSRQPPVATVPETSAVDPPTTQQSPSGSAADNAPQPPNTRQTAATLQLSLSGIIKASLPLSISRFKAELSLAFAPAADTNTSLIFPSTPKAKTPKLPSFLKPPLILSPSNSVSPKTTQASTSATIPTTADNILPLSDAGSTAAPVHPSQPYPEIVASGSSAAAAASATTSTTAVTAPLDSLKNVSSPSIEATPYPFPGSQTTTPEISPTASQFSTLTSRMPATTDFDRLPR